MQAFEIKSISGTCRSFQKKNRRPTMEIFSEIEGITKTLINFMSINLKPYHLGYGRSFC